LEVTGGEEESHDENQGEEKSPGVFEEGKVGHRKLLKRWGNSNREGIREGAGTGGFPRPEGSGGIWAPDG
jgi:hypothetical protein